MLPPDVNVGRGAFSVDSGGIRYGLSAIRSVGDSVVDEILREREENGPFSDLSDFIRRLSNKEANKRTIESFIFAGAFDSFGQNRRQMNLMYPEIIDQVNAEKKRSMTGQMSLMEFLGEEEAEKTKITFPNMPEFPKEEILAKEKEVLGIYVSGHPLDAYKDLMERYATASTLDFLPEEETGKTVAVDNRNYTLCGLVEQVNVKMTRNNEAMAFVTLEDIFGQIEVVVFPKVYDGARLMLQPNQGSIVSGRASISEEEGKLLASEIRTFDSVKARMEDEGKELWILIGNEEEFRSVKGELQAVLADHPGGTRVFVQLKEEKKGVALRAEVHVDDSLMKQLQLEYGVNSVLVRDAKKRQN